MRFHYFSNKHLMHMGNVVTQDMSVLFEEVSLSVYKVGKDSQTTTSDFSWSTLRFIVF